MRSKTAAAVAAAGSPLAGLAAAGNNVWAVGDQAQGSPGQLHAIVRRGEQSQNRAFCPVRRMRAGG